MSYRFSNKQERYQTEAHQSIPFQYKYPLNNPSYSPYAHQPQPYPFLRSPLQKFDSGFDFSTPKMAGNPRITLKTLSNNPYLSKGQKMIDYSSSSSESQVENDHETSENKLENPRNLSNAANNLMENPCDTFDSQSVPSLHFSDDSIKKPFVDIFQKAFILGLEKLKGKKELEFSPIQSKEKGDQDIVLEKTKALKLEPILPIERKIVGERNDTLHKMMEKLDEISDKFDSEGEQKCRHFEEKSLDEVQNNEPKRKEYKGFQQRNEPPENGSPIKNISIQVGKKEKEILKKSAFSKEKSNIKTENHQMNLEQRFKVEDEITDLADKPAFPLMKTSKNVFNTPTCQKYSRDERREGSSNKKPIWDEFKPANSKLEGQFFSGEKKQIDEFPSKPLENSHKKGIFMSGYNSSGKKSPQSQFVNKKLEILKNEEIQATKPEEKDEGVIFSRPIRNGVVVADRISLIDRKRAFEKAGIYHDENISSGISSYIYPKRGLVSPLQKI